jgi:anti-sigma-K factor RskA
MEHDRLKELLPLQALGILDGEDARAMAEHLATGCDECEAELRAFREATTALAINVAGDGSAERIWQKVERRFATATAEPASEASRVSDREATRSTDRSQREGVSRLWRLTAVAATAAALTLAFISRDYAKQIVVLREADSTRIAELDRQTRALASELEDRNRDLATLQNQVSTSGQLTQAVLAPDARLIRLAPLPAAPSSAGIVAVTPLHNHAILQVAGLPTPPPGKEYELWWIGSKSGPVKAALFAPDTRGEATITSTLPPAGEQLLASAVTLEPAGGVNKPTGAMYLKGTP